MNNRIQELARQATVDIKDEFGHWINSDLDKERFAKLIVQECISAVEDTNDRHRRDYFAAKIKQHFGIQE